MSSLLMPKATAVWLIDNTALTFEQIAEFCNLHILEVQAIADGDVSQGILGFDPVLNGQLTQEEIDNCCNDSSLSFCKKCACQRRCSFTTRILYLSLFDIFLFVLTAYYALPVFRW